MKKNIKEIFKPIKERFSLSFKLTYFPDSVVIKVRDKKSGKALCIGDFSLKEDEEYLKLVAKTLFARTLFSLLKRKGANLEEIGKRILAFSRIKGYSLEEIKNCKNVFS